MTDLSISEDFKLDVLKEMGNIGIGNAANALSQMMNFEKVDIYIPEVMICPLGEIPDIMGGAENTVIGVYIKAPGDVPFYTVFLLSQSSADSLIQSLTGEAYPSLGEMGQSVLREVGNIITASYLNALSFMTDLMFLPTPPAVAVDMAGAILGSILAEANICEDNVLVLKTALSTAAGAIEASFLIIPDEDSLDTIVNLLISGASQ